VKAANTVIPAFLLLRLCAQEPSASKPAEPAPQEEREYPEAEFVASDIFRSASLIVPLWRTLNFEGHYFGASQTDAGFTGVSWTFRWKELALAPGFGVAFGSNDFATAPALSFRWKYKKNWFITEGLVIQGFRDTPIFAEEEPEGPGPREVIGYVRPTISDGDHVSAQWKRLAIGGTFEHIQFREGSEWKGGGRAAFRISKRFSLALYVMGPGKAEWRGGLIFHEPEE
jgi:hypothetical protein